MWLKPKFVDYQYDYSALVGYLFIGAPRAAAAADEEEDDESNDDDKQADGNEHNDGKEEAPVCVPDVRPSSH